MGITAYLPSSHGHADVGTIPFAEREREREMKASERTLKWRQLRPMLEANEGTLIRERLRFKEPIGLWWTPKDVSESYPYLPGGLV